MALQLKEKKVVIVGNGNGRALLASELAEAHDMRHMGRIFDGRAATWLTYDETPGVADGTPLSPSVVLQFAKDPAGFIIALVDEKYPWLEANLYAELRLSGALHAGNFRMLTRLLDSAEGRAFQAELGIAFSSDPASTPVPGH